jgi:hypothetical protein
MKGFGGKITTCPIEATMPSASATSLRSCVTPRRYDISASINLDKSGFTDSRFTRIKQDVIDSSIIIHTQNILDNNIQGARR